LLPSKAIRSLGRRVVLTAVRAEDTRCVKLREEFSVPYLNSWVVVLDRRGETLASWIGDVAGACCTEESAGMFPGQLARLVRKSLRRTASVQELERHWRKSPGNLTAFDALATRLGEMCAFDRLRHLCREAAANPSLSEGERNDLRLQEFLAWSNGDQGGLHTRQGRTQFLREGENLLVELAHHPRAAELPEPLFRCGCAHGFDVPAQSARVIERLEKRAQKLKDPAALQERIGQFATRRREWIEWAQACLDDAEDASLNRYFAAQLGDAQAAIALCAEPGYCDDPEYLHWAREARRKARTVGR
jgi:hypothetical protein